MNMKFYRSICAVILLLVLVSCAPGPEETGRNFLRALQQHNFEEAASLSTENTAAIVLFMEDMLAAGSETGGFLDLPLPVSEPEHILTFEADGYRVLQFTAGGQEFILHGRKINGRWKIDLPRSSW